MLAHHIEQAQDGRFVHPDGPFQLRVIDMDCELVGSTPLEIDRSRSDVPRRGTIVARAGDIRPGCVIIDGPGAVGGLVPDGYQRGMPS